MVVLEGGDNNGGVVSNKQFNLVLLYKISII